MVEQILLHISILMASTDEYLSSIYYDTNSPGGYGGVEALFRTVKERGDMKISRHRIKQWLKSQDAYTLHKPVRWHYSRRRVVVSGIDDEWEIDLVDMTSLVKFNRGHKFLLTCIDVFSKYSWVVPMKNKSAISNEEALQSILKQGRKPRLICADQGLEFYNSRVKGLLKKEGIHLFSTHSELHASVIERYNRTLKSKMWRYFTAKNTLTYIDVLPDLVESYNHSVHRSIGMKPVEVNINNQYIVRQRLYGKTKLQPTKPTFKTGDLVRISKARRTFKKGYLPGWSEEVFTVVSHRPDNVYHLEDLMHEKLLGSFYPEEMQAISKTDDALWRVDKIIKKRKRSGKIEYFVSWKGYPEKFNDWVKAKDLKQL